MTTIGIVGSRHFADYEAFRRALVHEDAGVFQLLMRATRIVSGGARGVDSLAARWVRENGLQLVEYLPTRIKGDTFTDAARARNQEIAEDLAANDGVLIAMPGPKSKGSYDTIRRCRKLGVKVIVREVAE